MYIFEIEVDGVGRPKLALGNISAVGTKHDDHRTNVATATEDVAWIVRAFGKQARGASLAPSADEPGRYRVVFHGTGTKLST